MDEASDMTDTMKRSGLTVVVKITRQIISGRAGGVAHVTNRACHDHNLGSTNHRCANKLPRNLIFLFAMDQSFL
jgi:hypothetical protein